MRSLFFTLIAVSLCQTVFAQTLERTLDNGLKVIVAEDKRAPVVQTQLYYLVGKSDEHIGKTGLSHALEHMMFKGTKTVPAGEYSRRISALGGSENAYTSDDETVYHVKIAAQHLPEVLALEADRMANLNFSDADFNNEMKVIREERRQTVDDDPHGRLYETVLEQAWQKPINETSVIGRMADLQTLKAADLRAWYRKWYRPNNAVLVIVGDVDAEKTLQVAQEKFGTLKAHPLPQRHDIQETFNTGAVSKSITGATQSPIMILAWRVPTYSAAQPNLPYALSALADVLDGHSTARFAQRLVRGKRLALSIDTGYHFLSRTPQMFGISAMPSERSDAANLKAALLAEIADIAKNGVSEAELALNRRLRTAREVFAQDNIEHRASTIGSLESGGLSWRDEQKIRERINQVSAQEIQAAAQFLTQEREVFVVMLPEK